jgi:hypothetical protein
VEVADGGACGGLGLRHAGFEDGEDDGLALRWQVRHRRRLLGGLPLRVLAIAPLERGAAVVDAAVGAGDDVPVRPAVGPVARVADAAVPLADEVRVLAVLVRRDLGGALLGVRVGDAFLVVAVAGPAAVAGLAPERAAVVADLLVAERAERGLHDWRREWCALGGGHRRAFRVGFGRGRVSRSPGLSPQPGEAGRHTPSPL